MADPLIAVGCLPRISKLAGKYARPDEDKNQRPRPGNSTWPAGERETRPSDQN